MQLNSTDPFKFDHTTNPRQARFGYGPLLGILLANLLSNSAIAKFSPLGSFKISYDPVPWATYNKPNGYGPDWKPYGPPPTTSIADTTDTQHVHHHHHISSLPNQQQIVNINGGRPPTEIIIGGDYDTNDTDNPDVVTETPSQSSIIEEDSYLASVKTNLETPRLVDSIVEESRLLPVGELTTIYDEFDESQKEKKSVKRGAPNRYYNNKRNRYNPQKRRRYTTTPDYYDYDSYEEFPTSRYQPGRRTKPNRPIDSYEESTEDYEYDSFELTTKPYKKRRRTTTKPKRTKTKTNKKPQKVASDSGDDDRFEGIQQVTHIIEIRQRQEESTTPETMITNGTTITTTGPTTTTTSSTTTEAANKTGYGYGPSNGYENISITYGPPQNNPQGVYGPPQPSYGPPSVAYGPPRPVYGSPLTGQYQIPYNEWHGSHESGSNAIVRKIHDIIEFDSVFQ